MKDWQAGMDMIFYMWRMSTRLRSLKDYQLPKSTISDHLNDCFGFWFYKRRNRFDKFAAAFCESLLKDMPWLKGMGV